VYFIFQVVLEFVNVVWTAVGEFSLEITPYPFVRVQFRSIRWE